MSGKTFEILELGPGIPLALAGLSALKQPLPVVKVAEESSKLLTFGPEQGFEQALTFEVPWLPDMDALHVVRAGVRITPVAAYLDPGLRADTSGAAVLELPAGNARSDEVLVDAQLDEVRIRGLDIPVASGDYFLAGNATHVLRWRAGEAPAWVTTGGAPFLHFAICLGQGEGFGPPAAAFPHFSMPGNSGLYGAALAGGQMVMTTRPDGRVDVTLRVTPRLRTRKCKLVLLRLDGDHVARYDDGLPHEGVPIGWSAEEIETLWRGGLQDVEIDAFVSSEGVAEPDVAPVSSFPGSALREGSATFVDFSAAARSLLRGAHGARDSGDQDLALAVRFDAQTRGRVRYQDFEVVAEYRRFPGDEFEDGAPSLKLRGAPESIRLQLPAGLRPSRATLTLDGSFGRHALIPASDRGSLQPELRADSYRVRGTARVARWVPLPGTPNALPPRPLLTRVGVEGRAAGPCELLLALHRGRPGFVGERIGDPVALSVETEVHPRWHRAELGRAARAASRLSDLEGVWLVAEVSRGTFWWSAALDDAQVGESVGVSCLLSEGGGTWDARPGRPRIQVHHELVAGEPGAPIPEAIEFHVNWGGPSAPAWELLDFDLRPAAIAGAVDFRAEGVMPFGEGGVTQGISRARVRLDQLAELDGGALELGFDCVRDVDFRLLDLAFTYSPWTAKSS